MIVVLKRIKGKRIKDENGKDVIVGWGRGFGALVSVGRTTTVIVFVVRFLRTATGETAFE